MAKTYNVTGIVFGNYWGGGRGAYKATSYTSDSYEGALEEGKKMLKSGALDSGMGYESLIGALLSIETVEDIEFNGKIFTNKESQEEFIGDLTDTEEDFLMDCFYNI